jgi:murein L,D-transpeptidase YafK
MKRHKLLAPTKGAKKGLWGAALSLVVCMTAPCHANDLGSTYDILLEPDKILVEKAAHRLTLLWQGHILKTYRISLGKSPLGPKLREGDRKTPEGFYVIDYRRADSEYHRALHISYPNPRDRERARLRGVPPGKDIMIHGLGDDFQWMGSLHHVFDWTDGCIAVTDEEIEEIWQLVPDGTAVEIQP